MSLPDDLSEWRQAFLAWSGIHLEDLVNPGHEDIGEACETRVAKAQERIPARYATALATEPGVRGWIAALLREAIRNRRVVAAVSSGPSLLLLGPTGTGKTFQAYGALRGISACGVTCLWQATSAADLYARMRPRHGVDSEAEFETYAGAALLVLDDLGAAKGSEWVEEVNYRLVNYRYERQLPTLITSNLGSRDLAEALGERVASRLREMTQRVSLKGTDRRRAA